MLAQEHEGAAAVLALCEDVLRSPSSSVDRRRVGAARSACSRRASGSLQTLGPHRVGASSPPQLSTSPTLAHGQRRCDRQSSLCPWLRDGSTDPRAAPCLRDRLERFEDRPAPVEVFGREPLRRIRIRRALEPEDLLELGFVWLPVPDVDHDDHTDPRREKAPESTRHGLLTCVRSDVLGTAAPKT